MEGGDTHRVGLVRDERREEKREQSGEGSREEAGEGAGISLLSQERPAIRALLGA